jgi:hypothetical protein
MWEPASVLYMRGLSAQSLLYMQGCGTQSSILNVHSHRQCSLPRRVHPCCSRAGEALALTTHAASEELCGSRHQEDSDEAFLVSVSDCARAMHLNVHTAGVSG